MGVLQVHLDLPEQYRSPHYERVGGVVRDVASGRVAAWLREASPARLEQASAAAAAAASVHSLATVAGGVAAIASVVNVGVTAGFGLATLRTLGRIGEGLAGLRETADGIADQLQQANGKLDGLADQLQQADGKLDGLADQLQQDDGKLDHLVEQSQQADGKLDGLAEQSQQADGKLDHLVEQSQQADGKLDGLADKGRLIESAVEGVRRAVAASNADMTHRLNAHVTTILDGKSAILSAISQESRRRDLLLFRVAIELMDSLDGVDDVQRANRLTVALSKAKEFRIALEQDISSSVEETIATIAERAGRTRVSLLPAELETLDRVRELLAAVQIEARAFALSGQPADAAKCLEFAARQAQAHFDVITKAFFGDGDIWHDLLNCHWAAMGLPAGRVSRVARLMGLDLVKVLERSQEKGIATSRRREVSLADALQAIDFWLSADGFDTLDREWATALAAMDGDDLDFSIPVDVSAESRAIVHQLWDAKIDARNATDAASIARTSEVEFDLKAAAHLAESAYLLAWRSFDRWRAREVVRLQRVASAARAGLPALDEVIRWPSNAEAHLVPFIDRLEGLAADIDNARGQALEYRAIDASAGSLSTWNMRYAEARPSPALRTRMAAEPDLTARELWYVEDDTAATKALLARAAR